MRIPFLFLTLAAIILALYHLAFAGGEEVPHQAFQATDKTKFFLQETAGSVKVAGAQARPPLSSDPEQRLKDLPVVEHYGATPFYLKDPQGRMKRSVWNYFYLDQKNKAFAGYWEAEGGYEDVGEDEFFELLYVIAGNVYVEAEAKSYVAKPGDTVIIRPGRKCRITIKEPIKALFFCTGVADPMGYERMVLELMNKKCVK